MAIGQGVSQHVPVSSRYVALLPFPSLCTYMTIIISMQLDQQRGYYTLLFTQIKATVVTLAPHRLQVEGETLLGTQRVTMSLTSAIQGTHS